MPTCVNLHPKVTQTTGGDWCNLVNLPCFVFLCIFLPQILWRVMKLLQNTRMTVKTGSLIVLPAAEGWKWWDWLEDHKSWNNMYCFTFFSFTWSLWVQPVPHIQFFFSKKGEIKMKRKKEGCDDFQEVKHVGKLVTTMSIANTKNVVMLL